MRNYTKDSLNELQKDIDLEKVCDSLDMSGVGEVTIYTCPFCGKDSFVLNTSEQATKYYCFDCNASGDAIDLLMSGWKVSFNDAITFLSIMFNYKLEATEKEDKPIVRNSPKYVSTLLMNIMAHDDLSDEQVLTYAKFLDFLQNAEKKASE